ncbi:MAG: HAMP domain-containing histidine kinase [Treponema sp.]|nr:HAMP domain-containing histidine kinase [Treponema sp.]
MKIKTQFKLFLAGIILVPTLYALILTAHYHMTRPDRVLMDGYKQIRKMNELPMSERDSEVLMELLKSLPPRIEFIIIQNRFEVLYSSIPEFKGRKVLEEHEIFKFMDQTSDNYFYQLVKPPLKNHNLFLISRVNRDIDRKRKNNRNNIVVFFTGFLIVFETFLITFTAKIFSTVSKSITVLEENTKRIAGGELDVKLDFGNDKQPGNEITSLTENFDKMRLALKDDLERRTKFIMGISHDLRTPVAVIKGYSEALSDGIYDNAEDMQKAFDIITEKSEQLETMINTLIDFVKLNRTDWKEQLKKQPILPFLSDFAKSAKTTGDIFKRNVETLIQIPEETQVAFDAQLFSRALENIFTNAVRYTHDNDSIKITAEESDSSITIRIEDTGIGIDKKDLGKIFDMFYRGTSSRREVGMGVGLSVVKTIIDIHGWDIQVQSQKGMGSTFTITIPSGKH